MQGSAPIARRLCEEEGLSLLDFTACGMAADREGDKPALPVLQARTARCDPYSRTKICSLKDSGEVLARTEISQDGEGEPRATYTVTARIIILHKMGSDVSCFNISSVARLRGKVTQTVPRNHNF